MVDASWGVFCLEIQNFTKPIEQFDPGRAIAAPGLRTLVAVRDQEGQAAASRFYEAYGTRYFDLEQDVRSPDTVRGSLTDAGLDAAWFDRAMADPGTWDTVLAEHLEIVNDTRSFGVPTIRLDGGTGPAVFGPVIANPPTSDQEATDLWTHVSWLTRYDNFSELKRDRTTEPDLVYWRSFLARRKAEDEAKRAAEQAAAEGGS